MRVCDPHSCPSALPIGGGPVPGPESGVAPGASPRVAFGLRAATVAIKARAGFRVNLAEVVDLAGYWRATAPGDHSAGAAVARFLAEMHDSPAEAGTHMLDFLEGWVAGPAAEARRAEGVIAAAEVEVRALPEWTRRADCGLD